MAADLGSSCCADLDARVAELEATLARRGNRRVGLEVYGLVNEALLGADPDLTDVIAIDEALSRLEQIDARKARIVTLRYFAGLSIEETASALDLSPATVKNEWTFARAWLFRALGAPPAGESQ